MDVHRFSVESVFNGLIAKLHLTRERIANVLVSKRNNLQDELNMYMVQPRQLSAWVVLIMLPVVPQRL